MTLIRNSFEGGLDKDTSKTKLPANRYIDALNLRITTDDGASTGSLINIKGIETSLNIPDTFPVYRVDILNVAFNINSTITIEGQTSSNYVISNTTTGQQLFNLISTDPNLTNYGLGYNVSFGATWVVIYSTVADPNISLNATTNLGVSTIVPAQTNLIPIGFTNLRDEIYIYTTNCHTENPGGHDPNLTPDANSYGQIFKFTYHPDVVVNQSITIIYNGLIDLTTYRPIPTTASEGRYENDSIKHITFTDNFNQLRSVNVADPNLMAKSAGQLSIFPPVNFDIPILQDVTPGGALVVGCYQASYRLKNTTGATTNYSELSNMVFISKGDETAGAGGWDAFIGAPIGTVANKQISWEIENLDTSFDRVEVVILFRDTISATPIITRIIDQPIPTNGVYKFSYTGTEQNTITVTLTDFLLTGSAFTHCKTLATKDNRLFPGNVKTQLLDLLFDARAYSSTISNNTSFSLIENGVTNSYNNSQYSNIVSNSDAINASPTTQRYQYNSTHLGGTGPNISYEFGTVATRGDSTIQILNGSPAPFRHINPEFNESYITLGVDNIDDTTVQFYPTAGEPDDVKYPHLSGLYKSYKRNETYRFAITFCDSSKNPLFSKWIADIKMPGEWDTNFNYTYEDGTTAPNNDFRLSFVANKTGSYNEAFVNQLYVKFTVNIPSSLRGLVDGYVISRVERTEENKTILGQGMLFLTMVGSQSTVTDLCSPDEGTYNGLNPPISGTNDIRFFFSCPEWLLNGGNNPTLSSGSDYLQFNSVVDIDPTIRNTTCPVGSCVDSYRIFKSYTETNLASPYNTSTPSLKVLIQQSVFLNTETTIATLTSGYQVHNYDEFSGATGNSSSVGSPCQFFELFTHLSSSYGNDISSSATKKYLVDYVRTITNQYGGNTYTQRANNEYISCSHFRPIKNSSFNIIDNFQVFGGDVFTQIYDEQRNIKNWGTLTGRSRPVQGGAGGKASVTFFYPVECSHNVNLRHGIWTNHSLILDDGSGASGYMDYSYNTIYSEENNIKKYFPKPDPFINNLVYDNRVYWSPIKVNGELTNSWGIYKVNDYWDVEGSYGPINSLIALNSEVYFLQDNSFGRLLINPRALISDINTNSELLLGQGAVIEKHLYISNNTGSKHQWSVVTSPKAIYWFDINTKKHMKYSGEGTGSLSDLKGMFSYFKNNLTNSVLTHDNPIHWDNSISGRAGIHGYFDYRYNEVVYTIHDVQAELPANEFTICFSEITNAYTSFYGFTPYLYITDRKNIFSFGTQNYNLFTPIHQQNIGIHDNSDYGFIYGAYQDSYIKFVCNPEPSFFKVYDNLFLQTEVQLNLVDTSTPPTTVQETFDRVRVTTDYQDSGVIPLTVGVNIKRKHRYWGLDTPRDTHPSPYTTLKPRMRDFYSLNTLWFLNNNNKRLVIHDIFSDIRLTGVNHRLER